MDPAEFNDIKEQVQQKSFSDEKFEVLRSRISYSPSYISVMQIAELVNKFSFDDDQLKALAICQPKMIPASCAEVVSLLKVFSFAGTKVKVVETIASKISDPFNHQILDGEIVHRSDQEKVREILRSRAASSDTQCHHPPPTQQSPCQPHYYPHPNQPTYPTAPSQPGGYPSGAVAPPGPGGYPSGAVAPPGPRGYPGGTVAPPGPGGYQYPTTGQGTYPPRPGAYQPAPGTYPSATPGMYPPGSGTYQPAPGTYTPVPGTYPQGPGTSYPPRPGAYQLAQGTYPSGQGTYPPGQGTYPPGQGTYPPGQGTYPPGQGTYPPGQGTYPPGQGHPPTGYPPY